MKPKEMFWFLLFVAAASAFNLNNFKITTQAIRDELCNNLMDIIKEDEASSKDFVDFTIHDASLKSSDYNACYKSDLKKIVVRTSSKNYINPEQKPDFVLIIFGLNYEMADLTFLNFPDISVKMFLIIETTGAKNYDVSAVKTVNNLIWSRKYFNVLSISIGGNSVNQLKSSLNGWDLVEQSLNSFKFPPSKIEDFHSRELQLLQWNSPPFTIVKDRKLFGVEGKFLDTFCSTYGLTYKLLNEQTETFSSADFSTFMFEFELTLNIGAGINSLFMIAMYLGELDGLCFLTPRNIFTSEYVNSNPFDFITTSLIVLVTFLTVFLWKVFSIRSKSNFKLQFIIINILKCIIGKGVDGESKMSRMEKILIYSYTIGSMVLLSLYQSALISVMLSEPSVTSIQSFKELNESQTKIYMFPTDNHLGGISFRDDLVVSKSFLGSTDFTMTIPQKFDPDLAYIVMSSYADAFLKSSRNLDENNRRIFDRIPQFLTRYPQQYTAMARLPFKKEFENMIQSLQESGIRNHWISELTSDKEFNDIKEKIVGVKKKTFVDITSMMIPCAVLATGLALALVVFIIEILINKFKTRRMKSIINVMPSYTTTYLP